MDFTTLLKTIEEFLYELLTWVIFYPLTLLRAAFRPLETMRYAERELGDKVDEQFDDSMSPPIFLVVTLLLAHLIQLGVGQPTLGPVPSLFRDERNLLLFRSLALGLFPLLLALATVRRRKDRLTRKSLQPAFYAQCLVAGPFLLLGYTALALGLHGGMETAAAVLGLAAAGWYVGVQVAWLRSIGASPLRAAAIAVGTILATLALIVAFSAVATLAANDLGAPRA